MDDHLRGNRANGLPSLETSYDSIERKRKNQKKRPTSIVTGEIGLMEIVNSSILRTLLRSHCNNQRLSISKIMETDTRKSNNMKCDQNHQLFLLSNSINPLAITRKRGRNK